ncbi:hypothetical protein Tco_0890389 [Tanacetum coccineum]|uniref:Uncharacterized protein n=1 Tax=Tanacetum coccineum TaxID=301880 RepID=A0ABQ5C270_9ASTR
MTVWCDLAFVVHAFKKNCYNNWPYGAVIIFSVSLLIHDMEPEIIQLSNIDAKGLAMSYGLKQDKRQPKNYQPDNGQIPLMSNKRSVKRRLIDGVVRSIGMDVATRPKIADGHLQQE